MLANWPHDGLAPTSFPATPAISCPIQPPVRGFVRELKLEFLGKQLINLSPWFGSRQAQLQVDRRNLTMCLSDVPFKARLAYNKREAIHSRS
jgi:hypothetical protein